jgi:hypothetical protein
MKIARTPGPMKKARPPVRQGGQQNSKAQAIVDRGETRGAAAPIPALGAPAKGGLGRAIGSTGKGPPSKGKALPRPKVPKGPGLAMGGMLPGIAGPGPRPPLPLAIGQRPRLGARTLQAMRAKGRPR